MSDFDREWFGTPTVPEGFRLDANTDIHDGVYVVLVCTVCPRERGRVASWGSPVDLAYATSVARDHKDAAHGEGS